MKTETRRALILAGVLIAWFGLLFAWGTLERGLDEGLAPRYTPSDAASSLRLASSAVMFLCGLGLSLYAALRGGRLK